MSRQKPPQQDIGAELIASVQAWAKSAGVPVVTASGELVDGTVLSLSLDGQAKGADSLPQALEALRPRLIAVDSTSLDLDEVEDTVEALIESDAPQDDIEQARACRACVGHTASLEILLISCIGDIAARASWEAEWYYDIFGDDEDEGEGEYEPRPAFTPDPAWLAQQEAEDAERRKWDSDARSTAARKVAADPRFSKAKSEAARVLLVRQVLGSDGPKSEFTTKEIGREARALFDLGIA
jgi:hypothetical protein